MKKKTALFIVLMFAGLVMSGCGVQIKQEGNKIFTDADKDIVYKYTSAALEKEQYEIKERSREDGILRAKPSEENEIFAEIKDDPKVNITIAERAEEKDIMVTIEALISGDVDEKQSTLVARRAVDQLIAELNKYGMFTVSQEGQAVLPKIDIANFLSYVESSLTNQGYTASKTDIAVEAIETNAGSDYNDPMKIKVEAALQGNQVNVAFTASIEGNYDKNGNETKVRNALNTLTGIVENYPVIEKSIQQTYYYIAHKTAYVWSKKALDTLGYAVEDENVAENTFSSMKENLKITVSASDTGDNASAVTVIVSGEGGESKEMLENKADQILSDIKNELALYQIAKTDNKMFTATPTDKAYLYSRNALVGTGYKIIKASTESLIAVGAKTTIPVQTACVVNSLGNDGIAIEITSYVNGKKMEEAEAAQVAQSEIAKVIKYLGRYDKIDTK